MIVINNEEYIEQPIPKIGDIYNIFDDGKINRTRLGGVTITKIIPFKDISKESLEEWKQEVKGCHWLYNKTTDYFIKATDSDDVDGEICTHTFVRATDGGWFSMGYWASRLDIDGELYKMMEGWENK